MADPGPSTSQANRSTPQQQRPQQPQQQQQQQQQQEAKQNARKRRLSMNRKKGNKKGPRKSEDTEEQPNALLESLLQSLRTCPDGKELQALVSALQPSGRDVEMALNSVKDDLLRVLMFSDNQPSIYEFGSIKSGLLLRDSDLDFYVHFSQERNEREEQTKLIHIVCKRMDRVQTFKDMTKILGAKVPLLRAVHVRTNLQCDINFSNARGCYNSKFIHAVMQFDPRIHQLAVIVKFWARCAHVLTVHKQMNSYCLVMMLIFFLQTRKLPVIPSVEDMQQGIQRINYGPWNLGYPVHIKYKTWNVNTVRELLVSFFKYYSEFDFANNLISPFVGRLCSLQELQKKTIRELATYYRAVEREDYPELSCGPFLTIQDPFELNVNVGKVLRMKMLYDQLTLSFRHAYDVCQAHQTHKFADLLIALFTDTKRYQKAKVEPTKKPPTNATLPSTSGAGGDQVNGTNASTVRPGPSTVKPNSSVNNSSSNMCCLQPIEYELFLVKEILLARDPERKVIITDERIRQLWGECMLDFIVDILRKLYMVKLEPIEPDNEPTNTGNNTPSPAVRRFQMSCERQVFIARKRVNIANEADLKHEIEISKTRWEKNHGLRFSTRVELAMADGNVELRIPSGQPKNGPLRLFIDTCFLVHIRRCIRGYFMVMLEKAKAKTSPGAPAGGGSKRTATTTGSSPSESKKDTPEESTADSGKEEAVEADIEVTAGSENTLSTNES